MENLLRDILDDLSALESTLSDLENELLCDAAFESVLFGESDIALEANIIQKIKSGIAKLKSGKKNEGKKDLDEAVDELKEAEKEAEESGDEEQKKKLSKAAKIGIGIGAAAILAAAGIAVKKGMNKKATQLKKTAEAATNNKQTQNANSSQLDKTLSAVANALTDTKNPIDTLQGSINLARAAGVDEKKILKNTKEIDDYFMGDASKGAKSNSGESDLEKRIEKINKLIRANDKLTKEWFAARRSTEDNSVKILSDNSRKRSKIDQLIFKELDSISASDYSKYGGRDAAMNIIKKKISDTSYLKHY